MQNILIASAASAYVYCQQSVFLVRSGDSQVVTACGNPANTLQEMISRSCLKRSCFRPTPVALSHHA